MLNTFQSSIEKCLAHHIQISREWVHDLYDRIALTIIGTLGQRVVQNFIETLTHQLLTHEVGQFMLLIFFTLDDKRTFQLSRNLHIIISIDAQDILHHIAGTLHIHTIGRYLEGQCLRCLVEHLHLQALADALDRFYRNILTYKIVHILIAQFHHRILHRLGIDIADFHRHLTASQFLTKDGSLLQGINRSIGINTTFETETGIRTQSVATG